MQASQTLTRRRKAVRPVQDRLIDRIRATLLHFGGEAHRRDVIAHLAKESGLDWRNIPEDLEVAVIQSFEETWRDESRRAAYGFHLRFGEGSHRWGVLPEAMLAN
jgi:predicted DsbA family dithiol-disulfide isomerase